MRYMPIIRAVTALLPVGEDIVKARGGSEPYNILPNRLYVWPRRPVYNSVDEDALEQGRVEELTVRVRILYVLGSKGEPNALDTDDELSDALDAAAEELVAALAAHRQHPLWIDLYIEGVLPDVIRNEQARGIGIDVWVRPAATDEIEGGDGS